MSFLKLTFINISKQRNICTSYPQISGDCIFINQEGPHIGELANIIFAQFPPFLRNEFQLASEHSHVNTRGIYFSSLYSM
jgi:hypothetical protein